MRLMEGGKNRRSSSPEDTEPEDSLQEEDVDGDEEDDCVMVDEGLVKHKGTGDGRTPEVGMVFKSYEEASSFYKKYALRVGFAVTVLKSTFAESGVCRRLVLACAKAGQGRNSSNYKTRLTAKTSCPAMIMCRMWDDGLLHLVEMKLEHNHVVSPSSVLCYKRMFTKSSEEGFEREHSSRRERRIFHSLGGLLKLGEGDCNAIIQFLARMQAKNPNFFYLIDLDDVGQIRNLFWADPRSRSAYRYFGDVVCFDTSCLIEKNDMPLALFVGVNHHGQLVLLGCALVSEQTVETYTWLFKAWLSCMLNRLPNAIITDYDISIQDAVSKVFPGVRHRICLSHIVRKLPEKLKGHPEFKTIQKALNRAIFDTTGVQDFEEEWKKVIDEYKLQSDAWLDSLYQNRRSWHPVFLKDSFWAGLSMSKRGESTGSFFDGMISWRTSISHFLKKYEFFLENKYKKEIQADIDSYLKNPLLVSKFYMEEQIAKLYTVNMFKNFQDELKATMYCHASLVKVEGAVSTFEVQECSYIEDGKQTEATNHEVVYNANKLEVQCICGSFQFSGILCRHALTVFKMHQVFEIPPHYVLDRWRRDFKQLRASSHAPNNGLPTTTTECYDYLSVRFLQLVELGMASDDRYRVAIQLVGDMEKSLQGESARIKQPNIASTRNLTQEKTNPAAPQSAQGSKSSNSSSGKRRGRPPKQQTREPPVEINKEKGFLQSSLVEHENNVLRMPTTVTHLDAPPVVHGGIDLMENVSPTDLSFGSHFGLHMHPHHHHPQHHHQQPPPPHLHQPHHQQAHQQQHIVTQTRPLSGNLFQAHYDQQTPASQSRMQWIYNQMLQEDQMPKTPADWRIG